MMTVEEIRSTLSSKQRELSAARIGRDEISIIRTSEQLDELQEQGNRLVALNALSRQWETGSLISDALRRLEQDTFGICIECEEPIGNKRLAALPWAKYCIRCQTAMEN